MQALVSLLPDPYFQMVEDIWSELETRFGCQHVYSRPKPHFTWQYANSYDEAYAQTLERICLGQDTFEIQTDIITRFSEFDPVIFLRIVPNPELLALHRSEEHTSELQSRENLVCRLLLEKKKKDEGTYYHKRERYND